MMKKLLCSIILIIATVGFVEAQLTYGNVSGGGPPLLEIVATPTSATTNTPSPDDDTDFGTIGIGGEVEHTFTFTSETSSQLLIGLGTITGTNADQFSKDAPSPSSITGNGATSTFKVRFKPTSEGIKEAIIEVRVSNFPPTVTESYFFKISGIASPPSPNVQVFGDDNVEIVDGTFGPSPGDNTHYGDVVANLNSRTRSFKISNENGTDVLIISEINGLLGETDFTVVLPDGVTLTDPIPSGFSLTIDIVFTPTSVSSSINEFIEIKTNDVDFYYEVLGIGILATPDMDVIGNNSLITSDDSNIPNVGNHTKFEDTDINTVGGSTRTFTIENNGTDDLDLTSLVPIVSITGLDAADFVVTADPSTPISYIAPSNSTTFTVTFDPSTTGTKKATIEIDNNSAENPYIFDIQGEAIDGVPTGSPLMITQYYEGVGNDQWVEVKNISSNAIIAGSYNLALYTNTSTREGVINTTAPQQIIGISGNGPSGQILPGEVVIFKNSAALLPLAGNLGSALVTPTLVCTFNGDDVILISPSTGVTCYDDRIDIMGVIPPPAGFPPNWGVDKSFVKGCGTTELPSLNFDENDFIELLLEEVNGALSSTNVALGTQKLGATTWSGSSWSNGTSDRTRNATINGTYTAANGSFGACNLIVAGNINFDGGTSNYVEVSDNLDITGTFTLGDQESLYSVNILDPGGLPVSITGSITKFETTSSLDEINDYTYWSSPVSNTNMSTVFADGVYRQWSLYYWDQLVANAIPGGGTEVLGEWIPAAGLAMIPAKGYIAQGPEAGTYPMDNGATVSFSGIPNNGTIVLNGGNDVVFNNDGNAENDISLVGNPYPSAIDADMFINESDNAVSINGTLWFWTHQTANNGNATGEHYTIDDYASYNLTGGTAAVSGGTAPSKFVGSGQGFMVQTNSTIEKVTFTDGMRIKGPNTQFFRGTDTKKSTTTLEKDRIWLNVESSEGGAFNQTLLGFMENATDGFDRAYDGMKLSAGWISLYSKIDTLKYSIQGMSSFNIDRKVPMGFDTFIDDSAVSYKISIDHIEGALNDNEVYLVDNELNVTHDLKQADYNFTVASEGNYPDRFTLQFTKSTLDVDDFVLNNDFVVINEENALLVKSNTVIDQIKVYDITSRLLIDQKPKESEFRISTHSIRKGTVLILNTTFENGAEISKKAIKY